MGVKVPRQQQRPRRIEAAMTYEEWESQLSRAISDEDNDRTKALNKYFEMYSDEMEDEE